MPVISAATQILFISILLGSVTLVNLGLATYAFRNSERPSNVTFGGMSVAIAWWAFCYMLFVLVPSPEVRYAFNRLKYVGVLTLGVLWVVFAMQYTQRKTWWLTRKGLVTLAAPAGILLLIVLTDGWTHWWWPQTNLPGGLVPHHTHGLPYYLQLVFSYGYMLWGMLLYIAAYAQSGQLYRLQIRFLLLGAVIPVAGNLLSQFLPGTWDVTPFLFTFSTGLFAYAIFRYRFLHVVPIAHHTVLQQIPEGVVIMDTTQRVLDINPAAAEALHISPDDILGVPLSERLAQPMFKALLTDIAQSPIEETVSHDVQLSNGSTYHVQGAPLWHGRTGQIIGRIILLQNITEQVNARKQAETLYEQAERERQRLITTLNSASEGIILLDTEDNVTTSNPPASKVLPYTHLREFPEALRDAVQQARQQKETVRVEIPLNQQTFHASIAPVPGFGMVITLHDITPLTELMRLNTELLSMLSEDLRGPLSTISGEARLAQVDQLSPQEYARIFSRIDANARRLANFVSDILTISRLESGVHPRAAFNPVMMDKIAEQVVNDLSDMARSKGLLIRIEAHPHPPFYGDSRLLEQMWRNLVDNAIKYTDTGFITVKVHTEGRFLIGQVSDTGHGISPDALPHIFEKFYRLQNTDVKGIGIGLTLVKNIVEQHDGTISVESIPGKGTTFTMRFPLQEMQNDDGGR